jgi:hypothetical protein
MSRGEDHRRRGCSAVGSGSGFSTRTWQLGLDAFPDAPNHSSEPLHRTMELKGDSGTVTRRHVDCERGHDPWSTQHLAEQD